MCFPHNSSPFQAKERWLRRGGGGQGRGGNICARYTSINTLRNESVSTFLLLFLASDNAFRFFPTYLKRSDVGLELAIISLDFNVKIY